MKANYRPWLVCGLGCLLLLLGGCASLGASWPQQAEGWRQELSQGAGKQALASVEKKAKSDHNGLLYSLEAGRIAQLVGAVKLSKKWFAKAAGDYQQEDAAARIRLSSVAENSAALVTNDRAIRYHSEPYERIFSETFQALNYLALGQMGGAAVEFRRVDHSQRHQQLLHQRAIADADASAHHASINTRRYQGYFQGLNGAAALVRSGIENAYSYYLTAAFWEGRGDYNDALVDYKQALQILPRADFLKADIERVSKKLDGHIDRRHGLVVVAFEQGFVAAKQPLGLPIPTTQGVVSVSVPTYRLSSLRRPVPLRVRVGNHYATSHPVARVGAIAAHALKEKIPAILARQVLRTTAKYALQKSANGHDKPLMSFAVQLYNLLSERADLRSWLSLPANAQVARMSLPVGSHRLELALAGRHTQLTLPVLPAGVTLVRVIEAGNLFTTQVLPIVADKGDGS